MWTATSFWRTRRPRGPKRGGRQSLGRSRGGLNCRTVAVVDALGNMFRFKFLPGRALDLMACEDLLEGLDCGMLIGDRAFDADWLLEELKRISRW